MGDEESGYGGRHFVCWDETECDETTICETHYGDANARLIAASPSLYEYVLKKSKDGDIEAIKLLKDLNIGELQ